MFAPLLRRHLILSSSENRWSKPRSHGQCYAWCFSIIRLGLYSHTTAIQANKDCRHMTHEGYFASEQFCLIISEIIRFITRFTTRRTSVRLPRRRKDQTLRWPEPFYARPVTVVASKGRHYEHTCNNDEDIIFSSLALNNLSTFYGGKLVLHFHVCECWDTQGAWVWRPVLLN